jgi:hypothetical protein
MKAKHPEISFNRRYATVIGLLQLPGLERVLTYLTPREGSFVKSIITPQAFANCSPGLRAVARYPGRRRIKTSMNSERVREDKSNRNGDDDFSSATPSGLRGLAPPFPRVARWRATLGC